MQILKQNSATPRRRLWSLLSFVVLTISNAYAAGPIHEVAQGWPALDRQSLDDLRGGFITESGFRIGLAFESVVKVDGALRAQTVVRIPELGLGTARHTPFELNTLSVDRAGVDNAASTRVSQSLTSSLNTIVQNALDDRVIQHTRVLNIEISRIGLSNNRAVRAQIAPQLIEALR